VAFAAFAAGAPERVAEFRRSRDRRLPDGLGDALLLIADEAPRATRQSSQACLKTVTGLMPELVGGSADLAGSTGTATGGAVVTRDDYSGSTIAFGIREFGMAAIMNGLSLHGGFRVYGSTFLAFADYLRPALRLAALMRQPVVHVLTHDSIAVGEDGPTHQPVEQVESLRVIPGLQVLRPANDTETAQAWRLALERTDGPTALILSRQALPQTATGADHRSSVSVEIVATGSEVALGAEVAEALAAEGHSVRLVSAMDRSRYIPGSPRNHQPGSRQHLRLEGAGRPGHRYRRVRHVRPWGRGDGASRLHRQDGARPYPRLPGGHNSYTREDDLSGAALVADGLNDPALVAWFHRRIPRRPKG
jgi:transketolase